MECEYRNMNSGKKLFYLFLYLLLLLLPVLTILGTLREFPFGFLLPDSPGYLVLFYNLIKNGTFISDTQRTLGYPVFLLISSIGKNFIFTIIAQYLLFLLTACLAYKITYCFTESKLFSWLVAAINLYNSMYFGFCHWLMTEVLSTFLITLTAYVLARLYKGEKTKNYIYLSLVIGLAILARPANQVLLLFIPILALRQIYLWLKNMLSGQALVHILSALFVPVISIILLQQTFNYHQVGDFSLSNRQFESFNWFIAGGDLINTSREPYLDVKQAVKNKLDFFNSPDFPYQNRKQWIDLRNADWLVCHPDGPMPIIKKMYPDKWPEIVKALGIEGIKTKPVIFFARGVLTTIRLLYQVQSRVAQEPDYLYGKSYDTYIINPKRPETNFWDRYFYTKPNLSATESRIIKAIQRSYFHVCSWRKYLYFHVAYLLFLIILITKWRGNIFITLVYLIPIIIGAIHGFFEHPVGRYSVYFSPLQITLGSIFYLETWRILNSERRKSK